MRSKLFLQKPLSKIKNNSLYKITNKNKKNVVSSYNQKLKLSILLYFNTLRRYQKYITKTEFPFFNFAKLIVILFRSLAGYSNEIIPLYWFYP